VIKTSATAWPTRGELERYRHEYFILQRLAESQFTPVPLALEQEHGRPIMVIEAFGGQTLESLLAEPLDLEQALRIGAAVADAIADIHERHVIHKDIKPSNILIDATFERALLIDFGIASLLPVEYKEAPPPGLLEGTLPYMSPEQTGRMNRGVDYRSDLYSFGVTLYRMITGQLPFSASDPLEWCHCHLAQPPRPAHELRPELPAVISQILDKLLAKAAEDRYQSASGCARDLRRCLDELARTGAIASFPLAQSDHVRGFRIPARLYGRSREAAELLEQFQQTAGDGQCRVVLVAGYSGIGKSSLVKELYRPITAARGRFLAGKCEQYERDVPYFTLIQAFQGAVRQILAESDQVIGEWRSRILEAVGANGKVITSVIPEVEHIIGAQPDVPELGPTEVKNRFGMVFRNFVRVMARADSPLAVFLDDMQWADTATLQLLQSVFFDASIRHICFILAYRDNEVGIAHPFTSLLDQLERAGVSPARIVLGPLSHDSVHELLADTLLAQRDEEDIRALTDVIAEKTAGNPFFVIQFLTHLHEERLLVWDETSLRFRCDIRRVAERGYTDNVIQHMLQRLRLLQPETLHALETAACIGTEFTVVDLHEATGLGAGRIMDDLWPAVLANLLLPVGDAYNFTPERGEDEGQASQAIFRFLHDRVQQAAYSLLDEHARKVVHLRVGRAWRRQFSGPQLDERVFAITGQLNASRDLIDDPGERLDLAQLNWRAGRKAKASTAYASAVHHLDIAAELLPEDAWHRHYELAVGIHRDRAEAHYLDGSFELAETLFQAVTERSRTAVEKADVYSVRIQLYQLSGNYAGGLDLALEALALLGVSTPQDAASMARETGAALAAVASHLGGRDIAELVHAPLIRDPAIAAIVQLASRALSCAYNARPEAFGWLVALGVNTSLEHGITRLVDLLFSSYGFLVAHLFGDLALGFQYSSLAMDINERLGDQSMRGAVWQTHVNSLCYWNLPVSSYIDQIEAAFLACQEVGDSVFAGFMAFMGGWLRTERSNKLSDAHRFVEKLARFIEQNKNEPVLAVLRLQQRLLACLQGNTASITTLNGDGFDEQSYVKMMTETGLGTGLAYFHVGRQMLHYYAGEYDSSLAHARSAGSLLGTFMGQPCQATHYLFKALALCAVHGQASADEQAAYVQEIEEALGKWRHWTASCPANFASRCRLLEAEVAVINGEPFEAMKLYESAVQEAKRSNSTPDEVLACLAASRFYRARELETSAMAHIMATAHLCERWGAIGLRDHLASGTLRARPTAELQTDQGGTSSSSSSASSIDTLTILKAAQAISSELQLHNLVRRLLEIAKESAGADDVRLLRVEEDSNITVFSSDGESYPLAEADDMARSVVSFVQRTGERVLLEDARADREYGSDPHIVAHGVRSLLCLPITHQGRLRAMLYLENRLLASVFTAERASMLNLLSSQAAISMENAALYMQLEEHNRTLEEKVAQRTAELRQATQAAEESRRAAENANAAKSRFLAHVSHEVRTTLNGIMGTTSLLQVSELSPEQANLAHIIHRSSEGMLQLLNDLLDLSKVEAGKMELESQPFDLRACIKDVVELLSQVAENKGLVLASSVAADVPALMIGDAMRLRQILLNLLTNALKFTSQGSVTLQVVREPDDRIHFTVRDTGIGIPKHRLGALFSIFTQAETSTAHKYGGSGLGLAICKQFVELMNGQIWVESEVGQGTAFHVVIGAQVAAEADLPPKAPAAPPVPESYPLLANVELPSTLRVLLVEDNIVSQKIGCKMLEKLGCERVDVASDGQQAVSKVRENNYDVVLMDMMMPVMDGLDATRTIRNDSSIKDQPKIVGMTANAMSEDIEACRRAGMDDYLSKPVTLATLQAAIARTLAASGS
jgi:predicted ATPase/signal transduction histidine kinase/ActR/RegA family two-component response regulator